MRPAQWCASTVVGLWLLFNILFNYFSCILTPPVRAAAPLAPSRQQTHYECPCRVVFRRARRRRMTRSCKDHSQSSKSSRSPMRRTAASSPTTANDVRVRVSADAALRECVCVFACLCSRRQREAAADAPLPHLPEVRPGGTAPTRVCLQWCCCVFICVCLCLFTLWQYGHCVSDEVFRACVHSV